MKLKTDTVYSGQEAADIVAHLTTKGDIVLDLGQYVEVRYEGNVWSCHNLPATDTESLGKGGWMVAFNRKETITQDQIKEVLELFERRYRENVESAQQCGALSGEEPPFVVLKALFSITARQFSLFCPEHRAIQENLEKFL